MECGRDALLDRRGAGVHRRRGPPTTARPRLPLGRGAAGAVQVLVLVGCRRPVQVPAPRAEAVGGDAGPGARCSDGAPPGVQGGMVADARGPPWDRPGQSARRDEERRRRGWDHSQGGPLAQQSRGRHRVGRLQPEQSQGRTGLGRRTEAHAKWFVRHVLEYDGGFPWSGDVPCVARPFACAS